MNQRVETLKKLWTTALMTDLTNELMIINLI